MNTNQEFTQAFEKYMLLDKKTLAELLALKEIEEKNNYNDCPLSPNPYPYFPYEPYPYNPYNPNPLGPIITYCSGLLQ